MVVRPAGLAIHAEDGLAGPKCAGRHAGPLRAAFQCRGAFMQQPEVESNRVPGLIFYNMRDLSSPRILLSVFLLVSVLCLFLYLGLVLFLGLAWIIVGPLVERPFVVSPDPRIVSRRGVPLVELTRCNALMKPTR